MDYKVEKHWKHSDLVCVVIASEMGHRCGYVGIPITHPLAGTNHDNLYDIDVHGGLTYSAWGGSYPIPAVNTWWFGYDCAHYNDSRDRSIISEKYEELLELDFGGIVRDLDFCIDECERLAEQLKNWKEPSND